MWCFHLSCLFLILCFLVADTRFSVEDIEGALLKQLKVSKDTGIVVKKPEEENIRITNYGRQLEIHPMRNGFTYIRIQSHAF